MFAGLMFFPRGGDARQRGCGGVEISAFFRSLHYPGKGWFYRVRLRFDAVPGSKYPFRPEAAKWAEMATAKS